LPSFSWRFWPGCIGWFQGCIFLDPQNCQFLWCLFQFY
jgi:hypothetical protein